MHSVRVADTYRSPRRLPCSASSLPTPDAPRDVYSIGDDDVTSIGAKFKPGRAWTKPVTGTNSDMTESPTAISRSPQGQDSLVKGSQKGRESQATGSQRGHDSQVTGSQIGKMESQHGDDLEHTTQEEGAASSDESEQEFLLQLPKHNSKCGGRNTMPARSGVERPKPDEAVVAGRELNVPRVVEELGLFEDFPTQPEPLKGKGHGRRGRGVAHSRRQQIRVNRVMEKMEDTIDISDDDDGEAEWKPGNKLTESQTWAAKKKKVQTPAEARNLTQESFGSKYSPPGLASDRESRIVAVSSNSDDNLHSRSLRERLPCEVLTPEKRCTNW